MEDKKIGNPNCTKGCSTNLWFGGEICDDCKRWIEKSKNLSKHKAQIKCEMCSNGFCNKPENEQCYRGGDYSKCEYLTYKKGKELNPSDGWLPIETALKDGTMILIYDKECGVTTASWLDDNDGRGKPYFCWCDPHSWQDEQGGYTTFAEPTHWMPLPEAPIVNK